MKGRNFRAFLISRYEILDFFAVFIFAISEKGEFLVLNCESFPCLFKIVMDCLSCNNNILAKKTFRTLA